MVRQAHHERVWGSGRTGFGVRSPRPWVPDCSGTTVKGAVREPPLQDRNERVWSPFALSLPNPLPPSMGEDTDGGVLLVSACPPCPVCPSCPPATHPFPTPPSTTYHYSMRDLLAKPTTGHPPKVFVFAPHKNFSPNLALQLDITLETNTPDHERETVCEGNHKGCPYGGKTAAPRPWMPVVTGKTVGGRAGRAGEGCALPFGRLRANGLVTPPPHPV